MTFRSSQVIIYWFRSSFVEFYWEANTSVRTALHETVTKKLSLTLDIISASGPV